MLKLNKKLTKQKSFLIYIFFGSLSFIIIHILTLNQYTQQLLFLTHFPLFIFYAYIGFMLDLIFQTGMGYESLSIYNYGKIFITTTTYIYNFSIGIFIKYLISQNTETKSKVYIKTKLK
jgi:hypothetical protein